MLHNSIEHIFNFFLCRVLLRLLQVRYVKPAYLGTTFLILILKPLTSSQSSLNPGNLTKSLGFDTCDWIASLAHPPVSPMWETRETLFSGYLACCKCVISDLDPYISHAFSLAKIVYSSCPMVTIICVCSKSQNICKRHCVRTTHIWHSNVNPTRG